MQVTRFERLEVYGFAVRLGDEAWRLVRSWGTFERDTIGKQLVRAADSVGPNLAEGTGRDSARENLRFASFARGSLYESKHCLMLSRRRGIGRELEVGALVRLVDELIPRLNAYRNALRLRARPTVRAGATAD